MARYGGEEFAAILNNAGEREAAKIAESIRSSVEQCQVIWGDTTISITTSIGIAQFPAHGVTGAAVLDAADKALYAAKQAGRNQVRVAS